MWPSSSHIMTLVEVADLCFLKWGFFTVKAPGMHQPGISTQYQQLTWVDVSESISGEKKTHRWIQSTDYRSWEQPILLVDPSWTPSEEEHFHSWWELLSSGNKINVLSFRKRLNSSQRNTSHGLRWRCIPSDVLVGWLNSFRSLLDWANKLGLF